MVPNACVALHTKLVAHCLLSLQLIHLAGTTDQHAATRELLAATLHTTTLATLATCRLRGTVFTEAVAVALRKATCFATERLTALHNATVVTRMEAHCLTGPN